MAKISLEGRQRFYKLFLVMMNILGLTTVSVTDYRATRCRRRMAYVAFLLALSIADLSLLAVRFFVRESGWNLTELLKFVNNASRSATIISLWAISLFDRSQTSNWNCLFSIDAHLIRNKIAVDHNFFKCYLCICFYIGILSVASVADCFIVIGRQEVPPEDIIEWISVRVRNLCCCTLSFQYQSLVFLLGVRFKALALEMKDLSECRPLTPIFLADASNLHNFKNYVAARVRLIQKAHSCLTHLAQRLGHILGLPGLMNGTTNAIVVISHCFFVLDKILPWGEDDLSKSIDWLSVLFSVYWSVIVFGQLTVVSCLCEFTSTQASAIGISVHKLIDSGWADESKQALRNFSKLILHRKVRFVNAGIVEINAKTIMKILSMVLSNVLTLVQLKLTGNKVVTLQNAYFF